MSYKWPDKDKDEIVDYSVDWSRFLGDDSICCCTWYMTMLLGSKTEVRCCRRSKWLAVCTGTISNSIYARLSLGTNNMRYTITVRLLTVEA